jgi:hypothetical protein
LSYLPRLIFDIRLDAVIELSLPDAEQRLAFIAHKSLELLIDFLSLESRSWLESFLPAAAEGQALPARSGFNHTQEKDVATKNSPFDARECVLQLVKESAHWSLRDLAKLMANVRSEVLGTERYG